MATPAAHKVSFRSSGVPLISIFFVRFAGTFNVEYRPCAKIFFSVCLCATKEIRSGDQLEVEIYPEFTKGQKDQIPDEGKRKRQRQAQKNLNDKNSKKMCERVISENFTDRDIWATFTYTDDNMPASMEVATKNMQNYIRRLNYQRKKQGLSNARYVYVTECSEKGRWHHHIVMDGDVDMDTVEAVWNLGKRNEIRRLQRDENGLVGMARYITKEKSK